MVPRGAKNSDGAVAFMKFWIGLDDAGQVKQDPAQMRMPPQGRDQHAAVAPADVGQSLNA